jgi:hypothetical protein
MVGMFNLDKILDANEQIAQVRVIYRKGDLPRDIAIDVLIRRHGYAIGDANTILDSPLHSDGDTA